MQLLHVPPSAPQLPSVGETHWSFTQQPLRQVSGVHLHEPPRHFCPGAQAALPPHVHAPPVHPSASVGSQLRHVAMSTPHWPVPWPPGAMHTPFEQQPPGQLQPRHVPASEQPFGHI